MCIFASALYIKLGKQLILLYFKTMQNSDKKAIKIPVEVFSYMKKRPNGEIVRSCKQVYISGVRT